ncbi:MAG: oligosaccharide flippase family protein [Clostridia bacterium]|nr:oligosaccharide flippase family protein [Clostridia bacterium]
MASRKKQIAIGSIMSYISIGLNILAGLLYTPWMVRQIGQSQYGLYTLANSLITLFLIDFGLSAATARFVSKYHAEGDEEKVNNFLGVIYKLYLIIDAIIFISLAVIYFLLDSIYASLTPEEIAQFKVVYIIAGCFSIINFPFVTLNGVLTAYEKFIQQKLGDIIYRILLVGTMCVALWLGYGLYALVAVHAITGIILIIYKLIVIKTSTPVKVNFNYKDKALFKDIFKFSIWVTVTAIAARLVFNITPTILGVVSGTSAIAVFAVVVTIEGYAYTITTAINGMFMPKISVIYTQPNPEQRIMPLMIHVGRFQFALNALIIVGFALIGKPFINIWMGNDYELAYYGILLVLAPGLFFNSLQIVNTAMMVTNNTKLQALINLLTGIVNVVLSFILSYFYGIIGACVSICIAYSVRLIVLHIVGQTKMKFDIKLFMQKCYMKMIVPAVCTLLIGIGLNLFWDKNGWLELLLKGFIIFVVFILFNMILGLTKEERKLIFTNLKKKFR